MSLRSFLAFWYYNTFKLNCQREKMESEKQPALQTNKSYNPHSVESHFYRICEERGYFEIEGNRMLWNDCTQTFSLMMPPPNVTGVLHIGHALTFTLQDIITRYKRMDGYKTLYQPGLDHAGIATQNIVQKQLLTQGIRKEDLGRELFIAKVWEWKEQSGGMILNQMRHLGITPAWSRLRFTMDNGLQNAVKKAFVEWYNRGLIVQDSYMINWCVHCGALSDIEVEYQENHTKLYYLRYPIKESEHVLIVATTRPETFFGDTAVMVHPADERYAHLVGKSVILPLSQREIPIIADSHVDMDFGSGCVKVTPAHDINDYEVAKRHNLPFITTFDEKGILNEHAADFKGRERLEARQDIVDALNAQGYIEKIEDYSNQVGICYRCNNLIEPYISKQWFVKKEVATQAIVRVNEGELQFFPAQWLNNYNAWMRDLKDWCISRQLWWGHRIPVWYCRCGEKVASESDYPSCPSCHATIMEQDEDVLDTWFSSGLWAFSTLGWGNAECQDFYNAQDLAEFYPTSLLITGFDILFFWVARMLLSGESLLGKLPFKDVYLHALVRDENGQKMSKSKGNVIDPLEMIQNYGADTLRFTLAILCAQGRDVRLSTQSLELYKNFTNKLYNATQFLLLYLEQQGGSESLTKGFEDLQNCTITTPLGNYMLARFYKASDEVRNALESYRFNDGASILYKFLWGEFCDWGIELTKASKDSVFELGAIFKSALLLLHPYMPFITDYLWHRLDASDIESTDSIMVHAYPKAYELDSNLARNQSHFILIQDVIVSIRRLRAMLELGNKPLRRVFVKLSSECENEIFHQFVCKLSRVEEIVLVDSKVSGCVGDVSDLCECYIELDGIDLSAIYTRLHNQRAKLEKEIAKLESMLNNERFLKNAPQAVLEQNRSALTLAQQKLSKIQNEIHALQG